MPSVEESLAPEARSVAGKGSRMAARAKARRVRGKRGRRVVVRIVNQRTYGSDELYQLVKDERTQELYCM